MKPISRVPVTPTIGQDYVQLSGREPIRWARLKVTRPVPAHNHEFTEIALILSGRACHLTPGGRHDLIPGDVLVVPNGMVHAFSKVRRLELINIYFLPEWFLPELALNETSHGLLPLFFATSIFSQPALHVIHEFHPGLARLQQVLRELRDIRAAAHDSSPGRWTACCFFKALLLLAQAYRQGLGGKLPARLGSRMWSAFAEIDRSARTGDALDLERLARTLGYTRDHLARLFRTSTGETPNSFYQDRRLQFVCRTLLETNLTVAEIAHRYGYADEAHLCRLFRDRLDLTPSAYRRKFHHRNSGSSQSIPLK